MAGTFYDMFMPFLVCTLSTDSFNVSGNAPDPVLYATKPDASNPTLNQSAFVNFSNVTPPVLHRSPVPYYDVKLPIHSIYTFQCDSAEFPMVFIFGTMGVPYRYKEKPGLDMSVCNKLSTVRGCLFDLIVAHKCTNMLHNCTVRIEPPDAEREGCEAEYFSVRYQCVPAPMPEDPDQPYAVQPVVRIKDDPCDPYYQRKHEGFTPSGAV